MHNPSSFIVFRVTGDLAVYFSCYQMKAKVNPGHFIIELLQIKYKARISLDLFCLFVLLHGCRFVHITFGNNCQLMNIIRQFCVLLCMLKHNPEDCVGVRTAVALHRWARLLLQTSPMSFLHQAQHWAPGGQTAWWIFLKPIMRMFALVPHAFRM